MKITPEQLKKIYTKTPQDKIDAAKFVTFLNKYGFRKFTAKL